MTDRLRIVEVGLRDGLQNEPQILALTDKLRLIELLLNSGLQELEIASFVRPDRVPQMADSAQLMSRAQGTLRRPGDPVRFSALVPNLIGLEQALSCGTQQVAVFTAASEGFCQRNINCSVEQSYERFAPLLERARQHELPVRGYLSCIHRCPYDGRTPLRAVVDGVQRLLELGCFEVSLGDTLGTCTPFEAKVILGELARQFDTTKLALHFHATYGQALANLHVGLELGYRVMDSAIAGLGGCPYAKGASGNVATEDVVYMLNGSGLECGIELDTLLHATDFICRTLQRAPHSAVGKARIGAYA